MSSADNNTNRNYIDPSSAPLLAKDKGSVLQFILSTVPFAVLLLFFLYEAATRKNEPIYQLGDDYYTEAQWDQAVEETGMLIRLLDMVLLTLALFLLWTMFAVYMYTFVPKRRHLIGRYLKEGTIVAADVYYDRSSRLCGSFRDYGYAVYAHPQYSFSSSSAQRQQQQQGNNNVDTSTTTSPPPQPKMIRKRVRVFQAYTREKIAVLLLPNRPLSGQPKTDLQMDLLAAMNKRDSTNPILLKVAWVWMAITAVVPLPLLYVMGTLNDPEDDPVKGWICYGFSIILGVPLAYLVNYIRYGLYFNWMVNRGVVVNEGQHAAPTGACIVQVASEDGEAAEESIPYSIFQEDECSYTDESPINQPEVELQRDFVVA